LVKIRKVENLSHILGGNFYGNAGRSTLKERTNREIWLLKKRRRRQQEGRKKV